jgi:large subunit ribosomal protein L31e
VKVLREYIARHMNADPDKVLIAQDINALLWARGIQRPPPRITVRAVWLAESEEVDVTLPKV